MTSLSPAPSLPGEFETHLDHLQATAQSREDLFATLIDLAEQTDLEVALRAIACQRAYDLAARIGDTKRRVFSLITQIRVHRGPTAQRALAAALEALKLIEEIEDPQLAARIHHLAGGVYGVLEQYTESLHHCFEALRLYQQQGDEQEQASVLNTIGVTYAFLAEYHQAHRFFQQSLEHYPHDEATPERLLTRNNLAETSCELGFQEQARELINTCLAELNLVDVSRVRSPLRSLVFDTYARILTQQGELDAALHYIHMAREANRLPGGTLWDSKQEVSILTRLISIYQLQGARHEAYTICEELRSFGVQYQLKSAQVTALEHQALLHEQQGDFASALQSIKQSYQVKQIVHQEKNIMQLRNLQVVHETEAAQREAQLFSAENRNLEQTVASLEQAKTELQTALDEIEHHTRVQAQLLAENEYQRSTIRELSVPVLPLTDSALVMPLIGTLDTARLRLIQEKALAAIQRSGATQLILDITGVLFVDTQVAHGLINVVIAARLLGAQTCLIGIRPEVAQTIVGLGLDLQSVRTTFNLQTALHMLGVL